MFHVMSTDLEIVVEDRYHGRR